MYIYTDDLLLCQLKYCLCYNNKDSMHHLSKHQHVQTCVMANSWSNQCTAVLKRFYYTFTLNTDI